MKNHRHSNAVPALRPGAIPGAVCKSTNFLANKMEISIVFKEKTKVMSYKKYNPKTERSERKRRVNIRLMLCVMALIVLLIIWLTVSDICGNTDVAALNMVASL